MSNICIVKLKSSLLDNFLMANSNTNPSAVFLHFKPKYSLEIFNNNLYILPDLGRLGSQMANRYPFDSELFYSALVLLFVRLMLVPFRVGLKVKARSLVVI